MGGVGPHAGVGVGDLYERLQRIRDQRRRTPDQVPESAPEQNPERAHLPVLFPGDGWTPVATGVFSRRRRNPLPTEYAGTIGEQGRWSRVSPVFRVGEEVTPIFLDVETSGLSGGAGSVAFLVGLGRLTGGTPGPHDSESTAAGLHGSAPMVDVEQLLLTDLGYEAEFTAALHRRINDMAGTTVGGLCYVTYNGASFDLPVLRTRAIMVRRRFPEQLHLDLLAITRRLYASRIGSCRLGAVERRVLGCHREHDIPGSEVPERYLAFLRSGDPALLDPVIEHHHQDVANLAGLALSLNAVLRREVRGEPVTPPDQFEVLRLLLDRGHDEDRAFAERRMWEITFGDEVDKLDGRIERRESQWISIARLFVSHARRRGDWTAASAAMRRIVGHTQHSRGDVITLAKYLEHRARDYDAALELVTGSFPAYARDPDLNHRVERLRRKISRCREMRVDQRSESAEPAADR